MQNIHQCSLRGLISEVYPTSNEDELNIDLTQNEARSAVGVVLEDTLVKHEDARLMKKARYDQGTVGNDDGDEECRKNLCDDCLQGTG